jgi:hypothetical protein
VMKGVSDESDESGVSDERRRVMRVVSVMGRMSDMMRRMEG